tara:strand:- start:494 stop:1537 length:1044 start_codon:yes stop_codon:yes gene_type:complete
MKIGNIKINKNKPPVLISEISGNHNGSLDGAIKLVRAAAKNGSDLIKLQTYTAKTITLNSSKPEFIIKNKKSLWNRRKLFDLYSEGETPREWHYKIFQEAKKFKVKCFTSVFDEDDIDFLEKLNVPAYKVASFESTHFPLIEKLIKTKKPLLISTGMNSLKELYDLMKLLKKNNCQSFALLKCTSSYPAKSKDINLETILDMKKLFKCEIGFSDHTVGYNAAIGAVHYGASFIEKHICINNKIGIDSKFSLEVNKIKEFKNEIEKAYEAKGKIFYGPTNEEISSLKFRRSIFTVKEIKKGQKFTLDNIKIIRPANGIEPKYYKKIIGKTCTKNLNFATALMWKHINK